MVAYDDGDRTLWDMDWAGLVQRMVDCLALNETYQREYHAISERLAAKPSSKQFNFSQAAIFGNFDLFCGRIKKLINVFSTALQFSNLQQCQLSGLDEIMAYFTKLLNSLKLRKNYDLLDHRQGEHFSKDYAVFMKGVAELEEKLRVFIDQTFNRPVRSVELLTVFRELHKLLSRDSLRQMLRAKYDVILTRFYQECVTITRLYEVYKNSPPVPRDMTPFAGPIAWSRLLLQRIEEPMSHFRTAPHLLTSKAGRKAVKIYNKLSRALVQFEGLWHESWLQAVDQARHALQATVLVKHPTTGKLYVNFDQTIVSLCAEARHFAKMGLSVPDTAKAVTIHEASLFKHRAALEHLLDRVEQVTTTIPAPVTDMVAPLVGQLDRRLSLGLRTLCWTSLNIGSYTQACHRLCDRLEETCKAVADILSVRVRSALQSIADTCLCVLPVYTIDTSEEEMEIDYESMTHHEYLRKQQAHVRNAATAISLHSQLVHSAVCDVVRLIDSRVKRTKPSAPSEVSTPKKGMVRQNSVFNEEVMNQIAKTRSKLSLASLTTKDQEVNPTTEFLLKYHEAIGAAIFDASDRTFRAILFRIRAEKVGRAELMATATSLKSSSATSASGNMYKDPTTGLIVAPAPFISVDVELVVPRIRLSPTWDTLRRTLHELIKSVLSVSRHVPKKNKLDTILGAVQQAREEQEGKDREGGDRPMENSRVKKSEKPVTLWALAENLDPTDTFYPVLSRSRNILKTIITLCGVFESCQKRVNNQLGQASEYSELWSGDKAKVYAEFQSKEPTLEDFSAEIEKYGQIEQQLQDLETLTQYGIIQINTSPLINALLSEARAWKQTFGAQLNERAKSDLIKLHEFIDETDRALSKEVDDLEDVRTTMTYMAELREVESKIDHRIIPIEDTYAILSKYVVRVSSDESELVDQLRYRLRQLQTRAVGVQDNLKKLQPGFKTDLIRNVKEFVVDVAEFKADYDRNGPNIAGIAPQEAVIRLKKYQAGFSERERKWQTYSGGEELFGLTVTPYPEMVQMKKELKLLNALYGLYTDVLTTVDGYGDVLWVDLDFDVIAEQMSDYQSRCNRLPKAMRSWQAYDELKQKIEDFGESLPIFQLLSNDAVKPRHWETISSLCGTKLEFDDVENFKLKALLAAPLLDNKEDIEDICNSAVKELDIEEKLRVVSVDWQDQVFNFEQFKTRGLLLLAPSETSELIALLEDTQMILGSLVSNRYNAFFKEKIVWWVKALSTVEEILNLWLQVQQSWLYLEAVFSGGDIRLQLPQEAKRFSNIDSKWINIMGTAVQSPNVVHLTNSDDTLKSVLPYLLEQLEICQKSLSGYLEQKRNLFPRFYFVSDPVLLEILGQQSDPKAVQPHLSSIFDSVNRITFDRVKRGLVVGLNDRLGEYVELSKPVEAKGNIEDWLNDLIGAMQRSIKDVMRSASADVLTQDLPAFIESFPAQVSLFGIQLLWTAVCEQALKMAKTDKSIMGATLKRVNDVLDTMIVLTTTELTKRQRMTVETLVTIQVHQRDVFEQLVKQRIRSPVDFEWLKQTRAYWDVDRDFCRIQITDIDFRYNYEYLGTQERLVITPLTDRCYITLAQAIGMFLGGAPAGPAGTGKTETVKDMGKSLGMLVVVFNCSDQMDYKGLGKIFRGLAQAGCWGDFDEFNRIELEVLSVAAQQLQCVLTALKERKKQFVFTDGETVPLNKMCSFFITMNPGYAGRQELPENLKALFRTVAMIRKT
ncbi:dynein heavy chain [Kipferlia bialata]|uniref:Dynein heavy chain n=1 Tax=Kipferlia bialata TaxID=797122 RepID=A0A9K3GFC6_9EUKA|nr:dynein heavy chain [Kipferlia bialata]|eukprot:g1584.t1